MNELKFKTFMIAAESIGRDYMTGYQRGLRFFYHGSSFGSDDEHEKWMSLSGHRQQMGDGYRDGVSGKPPRGFHGNIGNMNAQGALPADSRLQIRLNSQIKSAFVKQSQRENMKLSEWVIKTLTAAIKPD